MIPHDQQFLLNELIKTKNEKRKIESTLTTLLAFLPEHIYWLNNEGFMLGCNLKQAKSLGYPHVESVIGKHLYDLIPHYQAKEAMDVLQQIVSTCKEVTIEETMSFINGERNFISHKVPIQNEAHQVIGILGFSVDITDTKRAERFKIEKEHAETREIEARASAEMEETLRNTIMVFADAIAHNQRTPLSIINGVADIFEKIHEKLMRVYEEAKPLQLKAIAELKERERVYITEKKGIDALHRAVKTMNENIDSNLQSLHVALKARLGTLTSEDLTHCHIDDNLKLIESNDAIQTEEARLVHIDRHYNFDYLGSPLLTDQIFDNLTRNALYQIRKHQKGEIFVTAEDGGAMNLVRFRDTAGGAPPEVVNHLFDTHFTTKAEGNGVGLAFCKTTMQLFGGDIKCHSVHGDYIEFVLSFPKLLA